MRKNGKILIPKRKGDMGASSILYIMNLAEQMAGKGKGSSHDQESKSHTAKKHRLGSLACKLL